MYDKDCLFCSIVKGDVLSEKVMEFDEFVAVKNKYPVAPIHILVIDKKHREKSDTISGSFRSEGYWDKMFEAIYGVIKYYGLDKTGYKLVNNGAGYNHFEHEHFHVLGGSKEEPAGQT